MTSRGTNSKQQIIETANRLIYMKGYNQTSLADVADSLGITKGNLHYHFRSKEALLDAVISLRLNIIADLLAQWDTEFTQPKAKLKRFVQMMRNEAADVIQFGCPIGSLNTELGKFQTAMQLRSREMFELFRQWLEKVFSELGKKDCRQLGEHLLSMTQGAALMSHVYQDKRILEHESRSIERWIESL